MNDYRVKGVPPDMTEAQFIAVLRATSSPVRDDEARAVYEICVLRQLSPAFLLALFNHESSMGTQGWAVTTHSWGNTRPPAYGVSYNEMVSQDKPDKGRYLSLYDDWRDGGVSTVLRLFMHPPYRSKYTVREIIPIWAPPTDGNNTERYIEAVLVSIAMWVAVVPPGTTEGANMPPKPQVNTDHPSPNRGYNNGFSHRVEAIINHITDGTNSLGWLTDPDSNASSNYLIARNGTIYELVPPTESAWANGQRQDGQGVNRDNPIIARWLREGVNFNQRVVSIEHENTRAQRITVQQIAATIALQAWLVGAFNLPPTAIFGHNQIDGVNRPHCPGWNEREWGLVLAGIRAAVTPPQPPGDPATWRGFIRDGRAIVEIDFGGVSEEIIGVNVQDVGVSTRAAGGVLWDRSVIANQERPWVRRD